MNKNTLSSEKGLPKWLSKWGLLLAWVLMMNSCSNDSKQFSNTYNPQIPDLHAVLNMKIQDNNHEEFLLYQDALNKYFLASNYMKNKNIDTYIIPIKEIMPLYIKESRLKPDAKSTSNAKWIAQLTPIALDEVKTIIGEDMFENINKEYKDFVYSMVYYGHIKMKIEERIKTKSTEDLIKFTYAAYNMGITDFLRLHRTCWEPNNRSDFAEETIDILGINKTPEYITDPYYQVENYLDRFGDESWYKDQTYTIAKDRKLPWSKIAETIRYVELTDAIIRELAQNKWEIYDVLTRNDSTNTFTLTKDYLRKLQDQNIIKEWDLARLVNYILVDNGITNHSPNLQNERIEIDESLLRDFFIKDNIKKVKFEKVAYNKNYYYRSILNDILNTNTYSDILNIQETNIYRITPHDDHTHGDSDHEEIPFQVKQIIDEAIIYFNYEKRINHNLYKNEYVLIPETDFVDRYQENRESLKEIVEQLMSEEIELETGIKVKENIETNKTVWQIYANPVFDQFAGRIIPAPKKPLKWKSFFNPKLKKALDKNGVCTPQYIVLHHTGAILDEKKDAHHNINAHFYIDRDGNLYASQTDKGPKMKMKIDIEKTIPQLNHAWLWTWSYGAIRNGDDKITYKAIGIEIETWTTAKDKEITPEQYKTLNELLGTLSSEYNIPEKNILTHSMVAVTWRNWTKMRWRKEDPRGFDYRKVWMKTNPFDQIDRDVANWSVDANITAIYRDRWGQNIKERSQTINNMTSGLKAAAQIAKSKKKK